MANDEQERATQAEKARRALIEAAQRAYEDAGIRGLCAEGRWEAAVSAMRELDLDEASGKGAEQS